MCTKIFELYPEDIGKPWVGIEVGEVIKQGEVRLWSCMVLCQGEKLRCQHR